MNQEHIMSQSLEQLREQFDFQLDLTLRLLKVSGLYTEKVMEAHFAMLQGVLQKAALPEPPFVEHTLQSLSDHGNSLVGYCKTCMQEGIDFQKQVLSELSRK